MVSNVTLHWWPSQRKKLRLRGLDVRPWLRPVVARLCMWPRVGPVEGGTRIRVATTTEKVARPCLCLTSTPPSPRAKRPVALSSALTSSSQLYLYFKRDDELQFFCRFNFDTPRT